MSERRRVPHFAELDGLRGIAALSVFFHHFYQASTDHSGIASQVAAYGFLGVQVFFVLSGFLITALLFVDRGEPHLFNNFYWKRALRILPPLLIYLALCMSMPGVSWHAARGYVLLSLLFVANFAGPLGVGTGVTWTLGIEEQFYLLWPQLIRRCRVKMVFWVSFWIIVGSTLLRLLVPLLRHDAIAIVYTPYQCDGLALGAILACQWFGGDHLRGQPARVARFLNGRAVVALWFILLQVVVLLRLFRPHSTGNLQTGIVMTLASFLTYRTLVLVTLKKTRSGWVQWLSWRPLSFVGAISYGLYLYHGPVLAILFHRTGVPDPSHHLALIGKLSAGLALSVVLSYASYRLVEMPIRGLRRFVLRKGTTRTMRPERPSPRDESLREPRTVTPQS